MEKLKLLTVVLFFLVGSLFANNSEVKKDLRVITLDEKNTISIKLPIRVSLSDNVKKKLTIMSNILPKNETIYLFMDTPGGSLIDGLEIIQTAKAIPQEVVTITQYSASMGFIIVQHLGKRYIMPNGIMMSHRAYGGVRGKMPEEITKKLKFWNRFLFNIDKIIADRIGISVKKYRKITLNDYWISGEDAVKKNMADEVVAVKCGSSMGGTYKQEVDTLFGKVVVTWAKCPLFNVPLKIDFSKLVISKNNPNYKLVKEVIYRLIYDKENSTEYLIRSDKFKKVLK